MWNSDPRPGTVRLVVLAMSLLVVGGAAGCKKDKAKLTQAQRYRKGCEYRVSCIEEMALNKAVTDANRENLRLTQQKSHGRFVQYCVKACTAGKPRFKAFARCGNEARDCEAYFRCESEAIKKLRASRKTKHTP